MSRKDWGNVGWSMLGIAFLGRWIWDFDLPTWLPLLGLLAVFAWLATLGEDCPPAGGDDGAEDSPPAGAAPEAHRPVGVEAKAPALTTEPVLGAVARAHASRAHGPTLSPVGDNPAADITIDVARATPAWGGELLDVAPGKAGRRFGARPAVRGPHGEQ